MVREAVLRHEAAGLTDGQLLEEFVSRHEVAALEALVRRHGPMVWGVCRRILVRNEDAEDAFQATLLVLVRKASSVKPREMVANWLYGVARQTALKVKATTAKRKVRERQVTIMPEAAIAESELWSDVRSLLDKELSRLPDNFRVVVLLCDVEGKTRKEVARQLGCPEGTVAGRLARAWLMLAKRLARHGLIVSGGALVGVLAPRAAASVPLPIVTTTLKAATAFASGQAAATGLISLEVAALTEGILKTMLFAKLKTITAGVLILVMGMGVTGLSYRAIAGGRSEGQSQEGKRESAGGEKAGEGGKRETPEDIVRCGGSDQSVEKPKKADMIKGLVKEVDEKHILLVGGESVLLDEKTEYLRETGFDAAAIKRSDVTVGTVVYIVTEGQGKMLTAGVVVKRLLQPPDN